MNAPTIPLSMYDALKAAKAPFSWISTHQVCQRWAAFAAAHGWNKS